MNKKIIPSKYTYFLDQSLFRKVEENGKIGYHQLADRIDIKLVNRLWSVTYGLWSVTYGARTWNNKSKEFQLYISSEEELKYTHFSLEECFKIVEEIISLYNIPLEEFIKRSSK